MGLNFQDNSAYALPGSSVEHRTKLFETDTFPNSRPYGHPLRNDTTAYQRDGFDPYQSSRECSSYFRTTSERSFSSISDASPYQSYRKTENAGRLSFENPSSMGRSSYGYPLDPPSYSSPGAHYPDPRSIQVPQDGFRRTSFESPSSIGRPSYSYPSDPPSYSHSSAHPGAPQLERDVSRTPQYEWRSPHPTAYGTILL